MHYYILKQSATLGINRKKRTTIICNISHLTELNIDVNVRRVVTQRTILPGTISLGTRNDNHATDTKIILGI